MDRLSRCVSTLTAMFLASTVLVGCSGGGGGRDTSPDDEVGGTTGELGEADGDDLAIGGDTDCISGRVWQLDIDDLAGQLAVELAAGGFEVLEYGVEGGSTLEFDEAGAVNIASQHVYTIMVITDADASITLAQVHEGAPSGDWGWKGNTDVMEFANWDSGGYSVVNFLVVNGIYLESDIPIPGDPLSGTNWTVECAGSKMTTVTDGSPFIHRWTTEG